MEIVWRTAMSMDGRLATSTHDLAFLDVIVGPDDAQADFDAFLGSVDAIVLGASTLRWLLDSGHGWPHGDKPTWLVSHDASLVERVGPTIAPLVRVEGGLDAMLADMEAKGVRRAWLAGGGDVAGQLLALGRIDEVEATIAPVALGSGPALFGERALALAPFEPVEARRLGGNAVLVRWRRTPRSGGADL